jgi:homoserine O-succinyltransferase
MDTIICASEALVSARNLSDDGAPSITIAVVNMMPDPALRATERQLCRLLSHASSGMLVNLKFYTVPGVERGEIAQLHIDRHYEPFEALWQAPPDGMIVTGAEPRAAALSDEAFWPALLRLIEWVDDRAIPTIWLCLAAHAAVLHLDGIERVRLAQKLSGVFECRFGPCRHQILRGLPTKWRVPHSRFHGLSRRALEAHGYGLLSWSSAVGADIFMKQENVLQLFLQGHPEYGPATLLAEYRRDVLRAADAHRSGPRAAPLGLGNQQERSAWEKAAASVEAGIPGSVALLDAAIASMTPNGDWSAPAQTLYRNWLCYVDARKPGNGEVFHAGFSAMPASASINV